MILGINPCTQKSHYDMCSQLTLSSLERETGLRQILNPLARWLSDVSNCLFRSETPSRLQLMSGIVQLAVINSSNIFHDESLTLILSWDTIRQGVCTGEVSKPATSQGVRGIRYLPLNWYHGQGLRRSCRREFRKYIGMTFWLCLR